MDNRLLSDLLVTVGQHVADVIGKTPDDVYVFLEAGDQWNGGAIFENLPDKVVYHDFSDVLEQLTEDMWEVASTDKKWSIIHYDMKDGKFEAEFVYTADMKTHPFEYDYRQDALDARYGDKPIIYPKWDEAEFHELSEDDFDDDSSPEAIEK